MNRRHRRVLVALAVVAVLGAVAAAISVVLLGAGDDPPEATEEVHVALESVEVPAGSISASTQNATVPGIVALQGEAGDLSVLAVGQGDELTVQASAGTGDAGETDIDLTGTRCPLADPTECTEDDLVPLAGSITLAVTPLGEVMVEDAFLKPAPSRVDAESPAIVSEEILAWKAPAASFEDFLAVVQSWAADNGAVVVGTDEPVGIAQIVTPSADRSTLRSLMADLDESDAVRVATFNFVGESGAQSLPSEEFSPANWQDPSSTESWHLSAINAPGAWLIEPTFGADTRVAVLDENIDLGHPDLVGPPEAIDASLTPFPHIDPRAEDPLSDHGTHVASLACARANETGAVGVAPACQLIVVNMAVALIDKVDGINAALENRAAVANLSLGMPMRDGGDRGLCVDEPAPEFDEIQRQDLEMIQQAYDMLLDDAATRSDDWGGMAIVTSAGNECLPITSDFEKAIASEHPEVLVVGSVDLAGRLSWFSNYSSSSFTVPVAAPGTEVWGATLVGEAPIDLSPDWGTKSGTSMAAPLTTGVVALARTANPEMTAEQAVACVTSSAQARHQNRTPRAPDLPLSWGLRPAESDLEDTYIVDALGAVDCARRLPGGTNPPIPVTDPKQTSATVMILDISGSMGDDGGDGRSKLDGGKDAVNEEVRGVEDGSLVGIRVYPLGSQEIDDCNSGFPLIPIGPNDPTRTSALVRSLTTTDDTPTSAALQAAAADLEEQGVVSATIVLVSDGEANCGPDPCETAAELAVSGIEFKISTVGFQISEAGREQLECIADATGATYADASNSAELAAQAARLSGPDLHLTVDKPSEVASGGQVTVTADLSSQGGTIARDVRLELLVDGEKITGLESPRRRIGNLPPGTSSSVAWTFGTPLQLDDDSIDYEIRVLADNLPSYEGSDEKHLDSGSIGVIGDLGPDDLGGPLADATRVALLGDGYASGEGGGDYHEGTDDDDNACHRSDTALGQGVFEERLILACSGATIADLTTPSAFQEGEGAQLQGLTAAEPVDAAVLSVGAGDVGLVELIRRCSTEANCLTGPQEVDCEDGDCPGDAPAIGETDYIGRAEGLVGPLREALLAADAALNGPGSGADRTGDPVPVVVMAYPRILPLSTAGSARCAALFDHDEITFLNALTDVINAAERQAVEQLRAEGLPVYFVGASADAIGHEHSLCARSAETYVNGLADAADGAVPQGDAFVPTLTESESRGLNEQFHPNEQGHRALTSAIVSWAVSEDATGVDGVDHEPGAFRAQPLPTGGDTVDLDDTQAVGLTAGATYRAKAGGFAPNSTVSVRLGDTALLLGTAIADDRGEVDASVRVPASAHLGSGDLVVAGLDEDLQPVLSTARASVTPSRPAWIWFSAVTALVFLLAAAVLFRAMRATPRISRR